MSSMTDSCASQSECGSLYEVDDDLFYACDGDYDSMDGNYPDEMAVPTRQKAPWDVITPNNIQQHQNEMLQEVTEVLACPHSQSRTLLIEYSWDKAQLIHDYVERGREWVFGRAGCPVVIHASCPSERTNEHLCRDGWSDVGIMTCECCFCPVEREHCSSMGCGHWFCNDCWLGHFEVQIKEGNACRLKCMAFKCGSICDEDIVLKLLDGRPSAERYQRMLLESYVNDNTNVKWCPSIPNCGNAIRIVRDEVCEPICLCGLHFCFSCLSESHSPCTCDMWAAWERKRMDDSETMNWITANTKPCPKCGKSVEKNGGCNLMTCRCGQHFCWLCGGSTGFDHTYHTISNHECGRWKQELDKNIDQAASDHKRYMHYFTRWNGHRDSLKKELENRASIINSLKSICDGLKGDAVEYNSLIATIDVLTNARNVLSNSYAFAFFLCGNDWYQNEIHPERMAFNQALFEDMQQQFEAEVERLSKHLWTLDQEGVGRFVDPDAKRTVETEAEGKQMLTEAVNCARTVMKRMQNFFDAINTDLLGQLEQSVVSIADFIPHHLPI